MRSRSSREELSTTTGMRLERESAFSVAKTSMPSTLGSLRSSKTSRGRFSSSQERPSPKINSRASAPSRTTLIRFARLCFLRTWSVSSTSAALSSTSRISTGDSAILRSSSSVAHARRLCRPLVQDLFDSFHEVFSSEWLPDKVQVAGRRLLGIVRHQQHLGLWAHFRDAHFEVRSPRARFGDIRHQKVDGTVMQAGDNQSFVAALGLEQVVPVIFKTVVEQFSNFFLRFNQQHGGWPFHRRHMPVARNRNNFPSLFSAWEEDLEQSAAARPAVYVDETVCRRHNRVNDGQAETGSVSLFLGGEERLEDMLGDVAVHADAGISDGETHERLRLCIQTRAGRQFDVLRL